MGLEAGGYLHFGRVAWLVFAHPNEAAAASGLEGARLALSIVSGMLIRPESLGGEDRR